MGFPAIASVFSDTFARLLIYAILVAQTEQQDHSMQLTNAEEQLMNYLWKRKKASFKDLKQSYPDPTPATTTISTLLTRLIGKGAVEYTLYGRMRHYYPLISKHTYFSEHLSKLTNRYFDDSTEQFASFLITTADMSDEELKKLRNMVDYKLNNPSDT